MFDVPLYIINNSIFLGINLVTSLYCLYFIFTKKRNVKNKPLYEYQRIVVFMIFWIEHPFAWALRFWFTEGIDAVSWKIAPISQTLYIYAENDKSIVFTILLFITILSIRRNTK